MTIRKTATRSIDNRRLYSLQTGEVFMPKLGRHVPWEGYGERAALLLADRRPGLESVVSQPERLRLHVRGKAVAYTPDYELAFQGQRAEVWEVKGHDQLLEPRVQEKLAAAELAIARTGRNFQVLNSRELNARTELRNVQLLRRYAHFPTTAEQISSITSAFRIRPAIPLRLLIDAISQYSMGREHLYALLYRGILSHDWGSLITDDSLICIGKSHENPTV
jgi:hypothetical protein